MSSEILEVFRLVFAGVDACGDKSAEAIVKCFKTPRFLRRYKACSNRSSTGDAVTNTGFKEP